MNWKFWQRKKKTTHKSVMQVLPDLEKEPPGVGVVSAFGEAESEACFIAGGDEFGRQ